MTITPGTPDDWTDTEEPERAEAFIERLPDGVGHNLRHYGNVAHQIGEECYCRPSRIPHVVLAAPESARPATLTPEQPVKAPGQGGDLLLARGTPVEADWPSGNRVLYYVDEGGYQLIAGHVGVRTPLPWGDARIVRVLTEDKPTYPDTEDAVYLSGPMTGLPDFNRAAFHAAAAELREQGHVVINPAEVDLGPDATWVDYMRVHLAEIARRVTQVFVLPGWESSRGAQLEVHVALSLGLPVVPVLTEAKPTQEPALPRPIKPEDVRVGMVVERRHGDVAHRDRVQRIDVVRIDGTVACLWKPVHEDDGWSLWLLEDAPAPVDPDAAAIEAIITAYRRSPECSTHAVFGEAMLDHLRAQGFDVTARAEQEDQ